MKKLFLVQLFLVVCSFANAQCILLPNATPGITLVHQNTNCSNNSGVAFNPNQNLYYGVRAGNTTFPLETWSATSVPLNQTTAGFDWRGMWWNPTTNQLEGNGYSSSGIWKADLNASGYALATGTTIFTGMNQPDAQSCGDLDWQAYEILYYFNGTIYRYSRTTNALLGSYPITGTPVAISNLNSTTLMYTGCTGKEIALLDYINKCVYVYNKANGAYAGTSQLPASAITTGSFRTSWANCHIWLFNLADYTWYSYKIFDVCSACAPVYTIQNHTLCAGDSLLFAGVWHHISGTYNDTLTATNGCDSIISSVLTILPPAAITQQHSRCFGDSIFAGGSWQHSSGTYHDTLTAASGCDSVVTHIVNIAALATTNTTVAICEGDSLFIGGGWRHLSGVYVDTLSTVTGCDSFIFTTLIVHPVFIKTTARSICQGDSLFAGGRWQYSSGVYTDTLQTIWSCDSIIRTVLSINPTPYVYLGKDTVLCQGDLLVLNATASNVTYLWSDNTTNATLTVTQGGSYWVDVAINSCHYSDTINVVVNQRPVVDIGPDQSLCADRTVVLNATTSNASYRWQDNSSKATYTVTYDGLYWVSVTVNNCAASDTVKIDFANPDCGCPVFIPNAFSPNNDGKNDEIGLVNTFGVDLTDFKIYNRWGQEVFKSQGLFDNWNGNFKGGLSEVGTYYYVARYHCRYNNKDYVLKGDITLLR